MPWAIFTLVVTRLRYPLPIHIYITAFIHNGSIHTTVTVGGNIRNISHWMPLTYAIV